MKAFSGPQGTQGAGALFGAKKGQPRVAPMVLTEEELAMANIARDMIREGARKLGYAKHPMSGQLTETIERISDEHMLKAARDMLSPEQQRMSAEQLRALREEFARMNLSENVWHEARTIAATRVGPEVEKMRERSRQLSHEAVEEVERLNRGEGVKR